MVLLILDTLRADKVGCYGFTQNTSPELDQMARNGVRFSTVVSQCSWTRPAIGSMLTSLYPRTLGIYQERDDILADRFLSLPEILQRQGFRTIGATANPNINSAYNFHQGFDVYIDSDVRFIWMDTEEGAKKTSAHSLPSAKEVFEKVLSVAASGGDRPCYVQITVMEMHEYMKWGTRSLIRPEFSTMFPDVHNRQSHRQYLQSLRQLSQDVDEFVKALRALPGWDDTLFLLVSDHGEGLDDHPDVWFSRWHGGHLYESQIRVPLIWYHPNGNLPAQTIEQRVRLLDLMPTLLDYLGIPIPDSVEGVSLLPLIRRETDRIPLPKYFVAETQFRFFDKIAVYSPTWKYIENRDVEYIASRYQDQGINPVELQAGGGKENGRKTDQMVRQKAAAAPLRSFLQQWESRFPKAAPTPRTAALSPTEMEQMKSIGYLE